MQKLSAYLIFSSFIMTLFSYFLKKELLFLSALPLWFSIAILFSTLNNKKLLLILIGLSGLLLGFIEFYGYDVSIEALFSINQYLVTLLIGVGFLRLLANSQVDSSSNIKRGTGSFIKTYASLHLFASTINLSALLLYADRFYQKSKKLSKLHIVLLTRSFSSDAYWSPFFVAFGAATTFTPNVDLKYILITGIIMALLTFGLTFQEIKDEKALKDFEGYPLNYQNLLLPFTLALGVLVVHYYFPDIKIIILVALFSILLALVVKAFDKSGQDYINTFQNYIEEELPKMKTEISLFLIAGFFGVSVSSVLNAVGFSFPFDFFDYRVAALVLFIFVLTSLFGVHTIISISIFGHMLQGFDHTFVAITFLMAWSSTIFASPFSGVNLTLHSRYGVSAKDIIKLNWPFLLKIYVLCVLSLFIVSSLLT